MLRRRALMVAAAAFAALVGVLAADSFLGVTLRVDARAPEGPWVTLRDARDGSAFAPRPNVLAVPANGTLEFRVIVENERPIRLDEDLRLVMNPFSPAGEHTVVDERVRLDAFASGTFTGTAPAGASGSDTDGPGDSGARGTSAVLTFRSDEPRYFELTLTRGDGA